MPLPPVTYKGALRLEEWLPAYEAHIRASRWQRRDRAVALVWWCGLAAIVPFTAGVGLAFVILMAGLTLWSYWHAPVRQRQLLTAAFLESAAHQAPFSSEINNTGFQTQSAYFADVRPWHALRGWRETPSALLLYESSETFRVIPKRILGSEERTEQLRRWFRERLGPPGVIRPGDGAG